jgi:hypothetical protein
MDDAVVVRVVESRRDAAQVGQGRVCVQRAVRHLRGQAAARDELHDHVRRALVVAEVVDVDDVGVAEFRDRLRLVAEAGHRVGVGRHRLHDLDRAGALQLRVVGAVDATHRALSDEVLDLVLAQLCPLPDRHGC